MINSRFTCLQLVAFISFSLIAFIPLPADSQTRNFDRTANTGKNSFLIYHHALDDACKTVPISIDFVRYPEHGTATAKLTKRTYAADNTSSNFSKCWGKKGTFIDIYYKSKPGFKGTDTIVYRRKSSILGDGYNKRLHRLRIKVQ